MKHTQTSTRRSTPISMAVPAVITLLLSCSEASASPESTDADAYASLQDGKPIKVPVTKTPVLQKGDAKGRADEKDEHAGHDHGPGGHGHGGTDPALEALKKEHAKVTAEVKAMGAKKDRDEQVYQKQLQYLRELDAKLAGAAGKQSDQSRYGGEVDPDAKLGIEFGSDKHEFGIATQGALLEHTFKMESAGTKPLIIRQAKPTCGCTLGEVRVENDKGEMQPYTIGDPIPPGRKIEVSAAMDTTNKRNQTQVRINVYHNDPTNLTQLGLSATVEPYMTATPSYVNLGDLSEDAVVNQTIHVRTAKGDAVKLSFDESRPRPKPTGLGIELAAVEPDADGRSDHWTVAVTAGPGLQEGPLGYAVSLLSDKEIVGAKNQVEGAPPKYYSVNANIGGRVLGVLSCAPQYLSMGLVRPGQVVSRSVRLSSHDPNFSLGEVKTTLRGSQGADFPYAASFSTVVSPVAGQAGAVDVELRLDGLPDKSDGSFKGELVIETGHPSKPEMVVTFSGVCRAGVGRPTSTSGLGKGK